MCKDLNHLFLTIIPANFASFWLYRFEELSRTGLWTTDDMQYKNLTF